MKWTNKMKWTDLRNNPEMSHQEELAAYFQHDDWTAAYNLCQTLKWDWEKVALAELCKRGYVSPPSVEEPEDDFFYDFPRVVGQFVRTGDSTYHARTALIRLLDEDEWTEAYNLAHAFNLDWEEWVSTEMDIRRQRMTSQWWWAEGKRNRILSMKKQGDR